MFFEVESNPNTESSVFLRFKEMHPPRRVSQIKTYDRSPQGEWCWVVGWTDDPVNPVGSALAQRVEDSGAGTAYVVYGGIWGIRLKPVSFQEDWDLKSPHQWGEPYLSLADERDLRYEEP